MRHIPVKQNFIYPDIPDTAFRFGSGQLIGIPINETGDWRPFVPPEEDQNRRGIESSACYIHALQKALATIQEKQFNLPDQDYSERFNALLSNSTEFGGDPIAGAQSIRHDGLIPDKMMSFSEDINSWEEFHSWKGVDEQKCRTTGLKWLENWKPKYDIGFTREEPVETKYIKLKEILKYCPAAVSVTAWYERDGVYVKPKGSTDNHLTLLVYIDEQNRPYVWDTYDPHLKILEPNYNFDFGMRLALSRLTVKKNWLQDLISNLIDFIKDLWSKL